MLVTVVDITNVSKRSITVGTLRWGVGDTHQVRKHKLGNATIRGLIRVGKLSKSEEYEIDAGKILPSAVAKTSSDISLGDVNPHEWAGEADLSENPTQVKDLTTGTNVETTQITGEKKKPQYKSMTEDEFNENKKQKTQKADKSPEVDMGSNKEEKKLYTQEELEKMVMNDLRDIASQYDLKSRKKSDLIEGILENQS